MLVMLIANLMALPLIYFILNNGQENFANRVQLPDRYFVPGGLLENFIAFLTLFINTYETAKTNLVKLLLS